MCYKKCGITQKILPHKGGHFLDYREIEALYDDALQVASVYKMCYADLKNRDYCRLMSSIRRFEWFLEVHAPYNVIEKEAEILQRRCNRVRELNAAFLARLNNGLTS